MFHEFKCNFTYFIDQTAYFTDQTSHTYQTAYFTDQASTASQITLDILHRSDFAFFTNQTSATSQIRLHMFRRSDFTHLTDQTLHSSQIRLHTPHRSDFAFFTDQTLATSSIRHDQLDVEAFMCVWGETSTLPVQRFDTGALAAVLNWVSEQINTNSPSMQRESYTEIIKGSLGLKMNACTSAYTSVFWWLFYKHKKGKFWTENNVI